MFVMGGVRSPGQFAAAAVVGNCADVSHMASTRRQFGGAETQVVSRLFRARLVDTITGSLRWFANVRLVQWRLGWLADG